MTDEEKTARSIGVLLTPHDLGTEGEGGFFALAHAVLVPGAGALVRPVLGEVITTRALNAVVERLGRRFLVLTPASLSLGLNRWLRAAGLDTIGADRVEMLERWGHEARMDLPALPIPANARRAAYLRDNPQFAIGHVFEVINDLLAHERANQPIMLFPGQVSTTRLDRLYTADEAMQKAEEERAATQQRLAERRRGSGEDVEDVADIVKSAAKPRVGLIRERDERQRILGLDADLRRAVFGQDHAVAAVAEQIAMARAGLSRPTRPIGGFLLAGPTGVGKTELARQLALSLELPLLRLDMSEYYDRHSISGLIGSISGYRDSYRGGVLTNAILSDPNHVLLFDEIEKGAPEVLNLLLQILDAGRITDGRGNVVDCRGTTVLMTTNLGARAAAKRNPLGFSTGGENAFESDEILAEVERGLSPELRNRIDRILVFKRLNPDDMPRFVGKAIESLRAQLMLHGTALETSSAAEQWLAQNGYNADCGARPLERLIDTKIRRPAAQLVLAGPVETGRLCVDHDGREFVLAVEPPKLRPNLHRLYGRLATDYGARRILEAHAAVVYASDTPLALKEGERKARTSITRLVIATPRDTLALRVRDSQIDISPGGEWAAALLQPDTQHDAFINAPTNADIFETTGPAHLRAYLDSPANRDATVMLYHPKSYDEELAPFFAAAGEKPLPLSRVEFLSERANLIGETVGASIWDIGYHGGTSLTPPDDPRDVTPAMTVGWIAEVYNFCLGVEEQKRLFEM